MSRIISSYELTDSQQDILWSDTCPYCSGNIISERNCDFAIFQCYRCDCQFICE